MALSDSAQRGSWRARLALDFERREARTALAARRHDGPLVVQKPLYPEGDEVCHVIVVHPPAGVAGGDELEIEARVGAEARALLTTPGAGKWYRSAGPRARQDLEFQVGTGGSLEWLPQETIVFDGARADLMTRVRLTGDASFIGWEILCLGRTGSGESFAHGECRTRMVLERDGKPLWLERSRLDESGGALRSAAILAGEPVCGSFIAASARLDGGLLAACRDVKPQGGDAGMTLLPGVLVARYLGGRSEAAKNYFTRIWRALRPAMAGREAMEPRIWNT